MEFKPPVRKDQLNELIRAVAVETNSYACLTVSLTDRFDYLPNKSHLRRLPPETQVCKIAGTFSRFFGEEVTYLLITRPEDPSLYAEIRLRMPMPALPHTSAIRIAYLSELERAVSNAHGKLAKAAPSAKI